MPPSLEDVVVLEEGFAVVNGEEPQSSSSPPFPSSDVQPSLAEGASRGEGVEATGKRCF